MTLQRVLHRLHQAYVSRRPGKYDEGMRLAYDLVRDLINADLVKPIVKRKSTLNLDLWLKAT